MNNSSKLLTTVIILLIAIILIGGIIFAVLLSGNTNTQIGENKTENKNDNSKPVFTDSEFNSEIESIYLDNIPSKKSDQVQINELYLALDVLKAMDGKGWNGDKDTPLPVNASDFDSAKLEDYVENELSKPDLLTIPNDLEDLFVGTTAKSEIEEIILKSHSEYLTYLKSVGTLDKYITEFNNVLPADLSRITYHAINDPSAPPTATESIRLENDEKDFSRLILNVYAVDIYNYFTNIFDSSILGELPTNSTEKAKFLKTYRDIATRQLLYHEMTHVLQQTYVNIYTPEDKLGRKSAWADASKRLMDVDTQYFWEWGNREAFQLSNNRSIANESEAEGVSFVVLTEMYNMSNNQKEALWEFAFGRLSNMQGVLNELKDLFQENYPEFSPDEFGEPMANVFNDYAGENKYELKKIGFKMAALPIYIGYLNPMLPSDVNKIWDALKN